MCLEVPKEVVPKDEDVEQYGKRPRLSLIPPRTMSQEGKRNKGILTCVLSLSSSFLLGNKASNNSCFMVKENY